VPRPNAIFRVAN